MYVRLTKLWIASLFINVLIKINLANMVLFENYVIDYQVKMNYIFAETRWWTIRNDCVKTLCYKSPVVDNTARGVTCVRRFPYSEHQDQSRCWFSPEFVDRYYEQNRSRRRQRACEKGISERVLPHAEFQSTWLLLL